MTVDVSTTATTRQAEIEAPANVRYETREPEGTTYVVEAREPAKREDRDR